MAAMCISYRWQMLFYGEGHGPNQRRICCCQTRFVFGGTSKTVIIKGQSAGPGKAETTVSVKVHMGQQIFCLAFPRGNVG